MRQLEGKNWNIEAQFMHEYRHFCFWNILSILKVKSGPKTLANTFIYSVYERLVKEKLKEKQKYKNR